MAALEHVPGKVVGVHLSYRNRAAERGTTPAWPSYFLKPSSTIVADLCRLTTLEPGDVILTGTPAGATVVIPGDVVEVEVTAGEQSPDRQSSGILRSPIVEAGYRLGPPGAMPRADDAVRAAAYGRQGVPDTTHPDVLAGLREVSTATLASLLRKRGLNGLTLDGLRSTRPGVRMAGYAGSPGSRWPAPA